MEHLRAERPQAKRLAVPGMEGTRRESFDVLLILPSGRHTVYQKY